VLEPLHPCGRPGMPRAPPKAFLAAAARALPAGGRPRGPNLMVAKWPPGSAARTCFAFEPEARVSRTSLPASRRAISGGEPCRLGCDARSPNRRMSTATLFRGKREEPFPKHSFSNNGHTSPNPANHRLSFRPWGSSVRLGAALILFAFARIGRWRMPAPRFSEQWRRTSWPENRAACQRQAIRRSRAHARIRFESRDGRFLEAESHRARCCPTRESFPPLGDAVRSVWIAATDAPAGRPRACSSVPRRPREDPPRKKNLEMNLLLQITGPARTGRQETYVNLRPWPGGH